MTELRLTLVENALDFFSEAVLFLNGEPRKLKYAILHLAGAAELMLKARLAQEHWTLIFRNPAKATIEEFERRKFTSVDFDGTLGRLKNVCRLDLSKHRATLRALRDMRNEIQHFEFSGRVPEITSILVKTWSFLWDFIHEELGDELDDELSARLEHIKDHMIEREAYVTERLAEIAARLEEPQKNGTLTVSCPSCLQETLVVSGEEDPYCPFCRYESDSDQVADDWATVFVGYPHTDPKERDIDPVLRECPACGAETMIQFESGAARPADPAWICFSCGESGSPTSECQSCGEELPWEMEEYLCSNCRDKEWSLESPPPVR